jgi:hypothetical protein
MLTWAMAWMIVRGRVDMPPLFLFLAMLLDVVMVVGSFAAISGVLK